MKTAILVACTRVPLCSAKGLRSSQPLAQKEESSAVISKHNSVLALVQMHSTVQVELLQRMKVFEETFQSKSSDSSEERHYQARGIIMPLVSINWQAFSEWIISLTEYIEERNSQYTKNRSPDAGFIRQGFQDVMTRAQMSYPQDRQQIKDQYGIEDKLDVFSVIDFLKPIMSFYDKHEEPDKDEWQKVELVQSALDQFTKKPEMYDYLALACARFITRRGLFDVRGRRGSSSTRGDRRVDDKPEPEQRQSPLQAKLKTLQKFLQKQEQATGMDELQANEAKRLRDLVAKNGQQLLSTAMDRK